MAVLADLRQDMRNLAQSEIYRQRMTYVLYMLTTRDRRELFVLGSLPVYTPF
jgi:hypothetical protein